MSDTKLAKRDEAQPAKKSRSMVVKPGHLEISEFTSGHIGASAPFGRSDFPLPAASLYYEASEPVPQRILDDERH